MVDRNIQLLFLAGIVLMGGCQRANDVKPQAAGGDGDAAPRASVALRVAVVNEPGLAEAINRLRGEWAERSGGELSAAAVTWKELGEAKNMQADLVVFPSRYLGEMCVRCWLRPVRASVMDSEGFEAADIFPVVRRELITWDGQVMALPLGVHLTTVPNMNDEHRGVSLLVEAAQGAKTNEREGVLFDTKTMKPRITEPVFVEALARLSQPDQGVGPAGTDANSAVSVLGLDDRLAGVTTSSRNAASAFQLLGWLAQGDRSTQLARAGEAAMPVRRSLASSAEWYDPALTADQRGELSKHLAAALNGEQCLVFPRIPGVDEYMAALDDAVRAAVNDKMSPQAALEKAAARWEEITNARGRDAQRQAYLKHLGISEP